MKKFICEDIDDQGNPIPNSGCGEISGVLFDGYFFGDRMLEGVVFKAFIDEKGELAVDSVDVWEKDPYLYTLNKEHWMGAALHFAQRNDVAECPKCGNEVNALPIEV